MQILPISFLSRTPVSTWGSLCLMLCSLKEGGKEESRWTEGRGVREKWEFKGFPLTHTHTHEHTHPHPHLAAGLLPSSLPSAGMSAWGLRRREAGLEDHRIGIGIGGLGQDWIIVVLLETSDWTAGNRLFYAGIGEWVRRVDSGGLKNNRSKKESNY